jgi:hypothetical protein
MKKLGRGHFVVKESVHVIPRNREWTLSKQVHSVLQLEYDLPHRQQFLFEHLHYTSTCS